MDDQSNTDRGSSTGIDFDVTPQARSTLADALQYRVQTDNYPHSDACSNHTSLPAEPISRTPGPLSSINRALNKQCFEETSPICLPQRIQL